MARVDVLMPQMGESIAEGTLSKWLKKVGDAVKRDEPLFEISTIKSTRRFRRRPPACCRDQGAGRQTCRSRRSLPFLRQTQERRHRSHPNRRSLKRRRRRRPPPRPKPESPKAAAPSAPAPAMKRSDGDGGGVQTAEERLRTKIHAPRPQDRSRAQRGHLRAFRAAVWRGRVTKQDILGLHRARPGAAPSAPRSALSAPGAVEHLPSRRGPATGSSHGPRSARSLPTTW